MSEPDRTQGMTERLHRALKWVSLIGWTIVVTLGTARVSSSTQTGPRGITFDGDFKDWKGVRPLETDSSGDGAPGSIDFRRIWVTDNGEQLAVRVELGRETILQNGLASAAGNQVRILFDLDDRVETGLPIESIGAELEVRFGERQIWMYRPDGSGRQVDVGSGLIVALPTHSARSFEIAIDLRRRGALRSILNRAPTTIRVVALEAVAGGDRLPDIGSMTYQLTSESSSTNEPIDLGRPPRTDLRLLTLNVEDSLIVERQSLYRRLFLALRPDVVALQSLRDWGAEETRGFMDSVLPLEGGRTWSAEMVEDCVTVSSLPILSSAAVDGNVVVLLDLSHFGVTHDLVLFNAHTPCCENDAGRDRESDHLAVAWRDMLEGGGLFAINRRDAVVFAGDFNLVGYKRQLTSIRDGELIDPTLGADFDPGRKKGSLATAAARHTHRGTTTTWRRKRAQFAPGRLDWILYSSDRLAEEGSFVLETAEMPRSERRRWDLKRNDSTRTSDHLAVVVDFSFRER